MIVQLIRVNRTRKGHLYVGVPNEKRFRNHCIKDCLCWLSWRTAWNETHYIRQGREGKKLRTSLFFSFFACVLHVASVRFGTASPRHEVGELRKPGWTRIPVQLEHGARLHTNYKMLWGSACLQPERGFRLGWAGRLFWRASPAYFGLELTWVSVSKVKNRAGGGNRKLQVSHTISLSPILFYNALKVTLITSYVWWL